MHPLAPALAAAALALAPVSASAGAAAQKLELARSRLRALAFEDAVQLAGAGLEAGDAEPDELAELYFLLGQASAAQGRAEAAQRAFSRALELAPGLELPPGASPKLQAPFATARAALGGQRLSVAPTAERLPSGAARIVVRILGDQNQLYDRGAVHHWPAGAEAEVALAPTIPPEASIPCAADPCGYALTLRDRAGNRLLEAGSAASPLFVPAAAAAKDVRST